MIEEGQRAPEFSLPDDSGERVTLRDYRGQKVVLWFYVRDDTSG
ncbi:MAG: redoxin domain-containing protein [bacterium]